MAVDVRLEPGFSFGKTTASPIQGIVNPGPRPYDVSPDGKSFIVMFPRSHLYFHNGVDIISVKAA
jgi:hypothetical protein